MRVLRKKYTGKMLLAILLSLVAVGNIVVSDQQNEADEQAAKTMYLQAYSMTSRADEFRDKREFARALELYTGAGDIYGTIAKKYPDWKSDVVANLNDECAMQIKVIKRIMTDKPKDQNAQAKVEQDKDGLQNDPEQAEVASSRSAKLKTELEKLKLDNKGLRRMIERLKREQENLISDYEQKMRSRTEPLLTENEDLRKRLQSYDGGEQLLSDKSLSARIVDLTEDNLSLNERLTDALGKIRDLRAKEIGFAKLAEKYEEVSRKNRELLKGQEKGYGELLEEQKDVWREKFEQLQSARDERESALMDQKKNIAENLEEARSDIESMQTAMKELKVANAELRRNLDELEDYDRKLSKQQTRIEDLQEELRGRGDEIEKLRTKNKVLEDKLSEFKSLSKENEKLAGEVEGLVAEIERMQTDHQREKDKIEAAWDKRLAKAEERFDDEIQRAVAENDELEQRIAETEKSWKDERQRLVSVMDAKYAELESERDSLERELDELSNAAKVIEQQQSEIDALVQKSQQYREQQKAKMEERNAIWAERVQQAESRAGEELEATRAALQSAEDRIESMDSDWQQRQDELKQQWRDKFEELAAELEARTSELNSKNSELDRIEKMYNESESGKLVNAFREQRDRHAEQVQVLRDAIENLKREKAEASDAKFRTEASLMEIERRYDQLLKKREQE